jgi:putative tryptophan/tyrosine transport system substrate-binding protein
MRRHRIGPLITLTLGLLVAPLVGDVQPAVKIPRIGILHPGVPPVEGVSGFQQTLRDLGYVEGQNLAIEYRYAEDRAERLPHLAVALVRLQVDVIFASAPAAVRAAMQATGTVPIVAIDLETDPVASGLVASLGRPGGNLTGLFLAMPEFSGKWLQLLQEAVPWASRVAVLGDPTINAPQFNAMEAAAQALAVPLQSLEVHGATDFEHAFEVATREGAGALLLLSSPLVTREGRRLAELAAKHRLPAISPFPSFAEAGGLMAYGPSVMDMGRRCAVLVDKILKGAKPGDLPIERPTKFELIINLKTAQALGLTIPPTLLFQADEVIR